MRFKDVFSIIGPAMIGPSSSHTAGAARIGRAARQLLGAQPAEAQILFYGSFAATYRGHGTDTAIVGGLLDFATDDPRLPDALFVAEQQGMKVSFDQGHGLHPHPNTARLILHAADGEPSRRLTLVGTSIGGGNIEIVEVNGFSVKLTGAYPTLVIRHQDALGVIADMTQLLKQAGLNIGHMSVDRKGRSQEAMTALELDGPIPASLIEGILEHPAVTRVDQMDLGG
ncbi:L-serine dehydratase [Paenibacillus phyllosphaerae]|uniref:L-serine deaminase n=1 Tax=Paenibacillus phyllosphaerae TaxID=274593 RepID=A0A7W5B4Y8_9BACL|nr:L-serine ammonia-lyase, iron-sulfur-dependent subunit beta [Paenibacillus phyllosphaerae]MBB3114510.1 L-serine dehydratase [Paenibacillus phyllosphaerae]